MDLPKISREKLIIFFILAIIFCIYPLVAMYISLFLMLFYKMNLFENFINSIFVSLGFGVIGFLYNPNYYQVGDVVRYYEKIDRFTKFDIFNANHLFDSFFYGIVTIIKMIGCNKQFLMFIFIFLIYITFFYSIFLIMKNENIHSKYFKFYFIFFVILYNPVLLLNSSRNTLAFMTMCCGIICLNYNLNLKGYICVIFGILIHISASIIFIIYLLAPKDKIKIKILFKQLIIAIISIMLIGGILYLFLGNNLLAQFDYYFNAKVNSYIYGKGSIYSSFKQILILIQSIERLFIIFIIFKLGKGIDKILERKYYNFCSMFYLFTLISIFNRTLFMRFSYAGFCFFGLLIIKYLSCAKKVKNKIFVIFMLSITILSVDYMKNLTNPATIGDGIVESSFYKWSEIIDYNINLMY